MKWLALLAMIALTMSHVSQARADGDADRSRQQESAKREFSLGQDADRAGHYEAAIGHYQRANDALPHPFNLYNIAVDYERLGNLRQAAEWYQHYLDAAPSSPDRDRVTRTIADLVHRDSPVSIRTFPDGAQVTIDQQPAGVTPLTTKLPGGTHHVAVDLDAQHAEKDLDLGYGEPADVAFTLGGQAGTLTVGGAPLGAYVAVDNITIGILPATTQISAGMHTVRVTASGFAPFESTANIAANAETHVDAQLVRALPIVAQAQDSPSTVAFIAGGGLGGELRATGGVLGFGMIGTRILRYDLVFRIGRADQTLAYDFLVRWHIFDNPVTPFLAVGYTYANSGYGYVALAGVRWDVVRNGHTLVSIMADGGLRDAPVSSTATTTATTQVVDPIELGCEVTFR
ncbi:MAG TPA: PEGA domain-containing protein [Kofleriaceae bacterium]|nr:PEGA domain-containing protein [Kofleriaceae bacterium]